MAISANERRIVELVLKATGEADLKRMAAELKVVQRETKAAAGVAASAANDNRRFGTSLQNVGFQMQDFAVQVSGGTSAMRAFSQQAPQMIGALSGMFKEGSALARFFAGPWGVALAVAASVLGPLISKLFETEGATKEAQQAAEDYDEAIQGLKDSETDLRLALADTATEYLNIRKELQATAQQQVLLTAETLRQTLERLRAAERERAAYQAAAQQLARTRGATGFLEPMGGAGELVGATPGAVRNTQAEQGALRKAMTDTANAMAKLNAATVDVVQAQRRVDQENKRSEKSTREKTAADKEAAAAAKEKAAAEKLYADTLKATEAALVDFLGNQVKQREELEKYAEKLNDAADPVKVYREELERLNEAEAQGLLSREAYRVESERLKKTMDDAQKTLKENTAAERNHREAQEKQREELQKVKEQWGFVADAMADATYAIITGSEKVGAAIKKMVATILAEVVRIVATKVLVKAALSLFGLPAAPAAKGAAYEHGVQRFQRGGILASPTVFGMAGGGIGVAGEAGPEMVAPLRRDARGNLGVGAVPAHVVVNNYAGAQVGVSQTDQGIQIDILRRTIADDIRRGGNPISASLERTYKVGRFAGAFG